MSDYFAKLGLLLVVDENDGMAYLRQLDEEEGSPSTSRSLVSFAAFLWVTSDSPVRGAPGCAASIRRRRSPERTLRDLTK